MNNTNVDPVLLRMQRTMANLEFIRKAADPNEDREPYEVTQLVNSFLGALVHPWEKHKGIFGEPIEDVVGKGWPEIRTEVPEDFQPSNLGQLIEQMRNAMAHAGIQYLPKDNVKIEAIRMVNVDPRCKHRVWGAVVTVDDMRAFLQKFVDTFAARTKPGIKSGR